MAELSNEDLENIALLKREADAAAEAGECYMRQIELSDGSIRGEMVFFGAPPMQVKVEWVAAIFDAMPGD